MIAEARIPSLSLTSRQRHGPPPTADDVDLPRIERAVREILLAIGENPDRDGLLDTPKRVAKSYRELFRGLREDPASHLARTFTQEHGQVIILRDIEFSSVCEHHLLPFIGKAHVAYIPSGGQVVGLSKLARTVEVFARRPQVQERMTDQIADALVQHLEPQGVAVIVEAHHLCMKMRGVNKTCGSVQTFALRGSYKADRDLGSQIIKLMCNSRR